MASKAQSVAQSLLSRAHSPDTATRIYSDSVNHRPLLLRATSPPPKSDNARATRRAARELAKKRRKVKPAPLSARQRRKLGLYDIPVRHDPGEQQEQENEGEQDAAAARKTRKGTCRKQSFATFQSLHKLWLGYVHEVLGSELYTGGAGAAAKLAAAEFHGAELEVVRSGCVSRVGIKGIVAKDAKFAFEMITPGDKVKVVPKEGTIFRVRIPVPAGETRGDVAPGAAAGSTACADRLSHARKEFVFEIHGDQFRLRSADRANRKFKPHFLKNL